jgi:hypothetical protein
MIRLPISLSAMRDTPYRDQLFLIIDFVQDPIVPDANPVTGPVARESARGRGARVVGQSINGATNAPADIRAELPHFADRGRNELHPVGHR